MSVEDLLVRQAGVITLAQAVGAGLSAATVHRRARRGEWHRIHPHVYLAAGQRLTDEARVRAASLWAGDGAVVSGPAAAFWHRMAERAPDPIELTVPRRRHLKPSAGTALRRRDLALPDQVVVRGVRVTAPPLTALETAMSAPDGSPFLDRALQRQVRFPAVYRAYCRQLGCRGAPAMSRLLAAAGDRADSAAERLLVTLLRRAGIGGWVLGHPFQGYRIDLAFPAEQVAVEVDGWAWHVDPERFRADRRKGNAITAAGWDLLRFTWHDLDAIPDTVIAEIDAATSSPNRVRGAG